MTLRRIGQTASDERGSVIVAGAVLIVALAMLGAGVIEVGEWFQHRRNLQVRTDAAALAAGQAFNACFNIGAGGPYANEQAADTEIESWARAYGGVQAKGTQLYNKRFDQPGALMSFQSDTAPSSANPQPTQNLGHECFVNGDPTNTSPSNWNLMEDVRTTQEGLSPFFSLAPSVTIHGWARVQLQVIKALRPSMPLAIPDVNPKAVAVTFVNNATGQALSGCTQAPIQPCTFPLAGPTSSGTINGWNGTATFPMPSAPDVNVGMRVSIGAQNGNCANVTATNAYTCYDYSSSKGILAIRSYSSAAVTGTTPILRAVTPTTCSGTPYFSNLQATPATGNCDNVGVAAVVNFPSGATNQSVTYAIAQGGCPNRINGSMTQSGTTWASGLSSLPTANGIYDVCIAWSYGSGRNQQQGVFNNGNPVQEIFSGSDGSDPALPGGPIMSAGLAGGTTPYSFVAGSTATVSVSIGLTGGVHVNQRCFNGTSGKNYSCATDPPVLLRTANTSGSLNYAIDCGTIPGNNGGNLYQMVRYGCANSFSINVADICPDQGPAPTPPDCAPVMTGDKTGQVRQALNDRFAVGNNGCAPNNYPNTAVAGDPRIVRLVDTDFSAYLGNQGGSSSSDVPVVTFATFYVTGWDGASNACAAVNEPPPPNSDTKGNSSNLWGHFISYETDGTPSGTKCVGGSVVPCVAALVR